MGSLGIRNKRRPGYNCVVDDIWQRGYKTVGILAGVRDRWTAKHTRVSLGMCDIFVVTPTQIISVRALGETDLNPVSGLGKISQLIFAVVQPSNVVANLIAGGVSSSYCPLGQLITTFSKGWQKLVHSSKLNNEQPAIHLRRTCLQGW